MDRMSARGVEKGEEPEFGDLVIDMSSRELLVVQHVSDSFIPGGELCWYANAFGTGQAAGTISFKEWKAGIRYRHLGKLDERAWRGAIEDAKTPKVVCLDGCDGNTGKMMRTSDLTCEACGLLFHKHPYCFQSKLPESMQSSLVRPDYYLHVLCDGRHVKL